MTDSSDPRRPKSSRKKPSREPATLDLKATIINDGSPRADAPGSAQDTFGPETPGQETLGQDTSGVVPEHGVLSEGLRAEETIAAGGLKEPGPEETIASAGEPPAEDVVASPEATLDSGIGTDTLPSGSSVDEAPARDATERETAEPAAARPEAVPPQSPERRGSAAALVGSGLLGGLIGAGLLYGLQAWQENPAESQPVELRLAQIEQRLGALRQPGPPGPLQGNVQALGERVQALETTRGDLDQRLQAIQDTAQQTATQAQQAAAQAQQAVTQAQEALNRPMPEAPQPPPQNEAALTELSSRLSGLEEQVRGNAQNATDAAAARQDLDRRIADLDRRSGDQDRRFGEAERRFADVENRFGEQEQRLAALSEQAAALSRQAAENTRNAEAASQTGTRVVLAGRLNDALHSGSPYAEVLDGVKKAGGDPARVAALEPFAGQGAPTAQELAQSFEPVETAILRESRGPAEGWTDRLLRMADRVVTVKPVDGQGSTGVPALVARIGQALQRGDVVEAAAAWDALPEPSRRLSEEWGRQVKAVAQAHQAAQAISTDALATLNRTTQ